MIILINHHLSRFVGIWLQCFKIHMRSTSMITVDITGKHKNLVFPHIFYPRRSDSILESWQTIFRKPLRILFLFSVAKILILLQISFVKSESHYKKRKIICLIANPIDFCMIYSDSFPLYLAYHYILLKWKQMCLLIRFFFCSWFMNAKIGKIPLFSMLIFVFPYFHFGVSQLCCS